MSSTARQPAVAEATEPAPRGLDSRRRAGARGAQPPVPLRLILHLPRDVTTVSMARRVVDTALAMIGVADGCRGDIALALSEACTNAVAHAQVGDGYEVVVTVHDGRCVFEVIDAGVGLETAVLGASLLDVVAEHGRGLLLIGSCTDSVELRRVDPHGLAVRMSKTLTWKPVRYPS
jgi:serine/threonine-protein kinase RsbW